MDEKEVAALAAQAKAGDVSAFERLYSSHVSSILLHARNLLIDKESYTDVAQDVALEMFESINTLREPAAFRGWMHQLIRTACATRNRQFIRQSNRVDLAEDDDALEAIEDQGADASPEAVSMAGMEGNWLFAKINELPLSYREVITQFYYDEMSYKEIAEALDISVTNVSTRLQRAMEALRSKIGEQDTGAKAPRKVMREASMTKERTTAKVKISEEAHTVATDPHLSEKGLQDDIGVRSSLASAVAVLASEDTVKMVMDSVHTKLAANIGTSTVAQTAGAAGANKRVSAAIYTLTALVLVVALALGGLALWSQMGVLSAPDGEPANEQTQVNYYEGNPRIVFVNAAGEETDHNIVSASVVEDEPAFVTTSWSMYALAGGVDAAGAVAGIESASEAETISIPSDAILIQSGSGSTINSAVLDSLEPGSYQVVFSLQDSRGATAEVARTFTITE